MDPHRVRLLPTARTGCTLLACVALALCGSALLAKDKPKPELPARDLSVELRQVDDGPAGGYTVSTAPAVPTWPAQAMRVRNGETASLHIGQSMPVQWVQAVAAQSSSVAASGVNLSSKGGSVHNAMTWINSGQDLELTPRWRGGKEDVTVEVAVRSTQLGTQSASGLPSLNQSELVTTVSAPLGYWVVIAASGGTGASKGSYSSQPANEVRRTIQVRVTAP